MADEKKKPGLAEAMAKKPAAAKADYDSEDSGAFDVAAEELFEAVKASDLDAFKSALRAVKSC